ncbi:hypothetical protein CMI47_22115 [Candidatus Pacearchaeota archaeon]|jgi:hypothetical protein|nr:hypothetical protein [Candidatus Pacearchaeota archaeon]|tara:strand:+ start:1653 stop:4541 length:2889 start_codon:yes stop_codon:yes gene_type:complete
MKEELYINNERIELLESLRPNLTFNIADIAKPDTRKSDFSKTIKLPGSKKLNKQFEHIFEVNIDLQTFNPNLKTDVLYLVDGETSLDGYLQLKQIDILDNDDVIYQCTIIGRVGDFIKELGDSELTDLDLSALNHTYNKATQAATWGTPLPLDYVYPMIDYGTHYDWSDWTIQDFFPAITAYKYLDTMFNDAGYTWTSDFLDSAFFKTLIIPCSTRDFALSKTDIEDRIFEANTAEWDNGTTNLLVDETTPLLYLDPKEEKIILTNEVADVGGVYNDTTGVFTATESGYYNFNIQVEINVEFAPTGASETTTAYCALGGFLELRKNSSAIDTNSIGITLGATIGSGSTGTTAASPTYPDTDYRDGMSLAPDKILLGAGGRYYSPPNKYFLQATNVYIAATDTVTVYGNFYFAPIFGTSATTGNLFQGVSTSWYDGTATVKLISGKFFNQVVNSGYVEGNTISMNNTIPKKIKQKDFFMSLVKMFNLYVQSDTQNDKNVFIEPRDDFYDTTIKDWSQKLDVSKQLEYLPMGALDSKDYLFTYKADKDYYNDLYTKTWDEIYGQEKEGITNDFVKNTYKTEIIFSPTPSKGILANDRIIPSIIKTDEDGKAQRTESNIRILQWGGMLDTAQIWEHKDSSATSKKKYPYAGHYDEPYTPTVDINFGLTQEIYWDNTYETITWNNNNLYNKYYKKFIEEITDVNSKVVKGWFYLRPGDIRSLSFRSQYYFDGAYFRLNKIENYNPDSPVTKCEFLKIKDADVFTPTTATATGAIQDIAGKPEPKFSSGSDVLKAGNSYASLEQKVMGENNYINRTATGINITGNSNKVFSGANNIIIQGDSNTVQSGLSDVTLINTNSVTVISDGVTYLNGELIGEGSVISITSSTAADESIKTYEVDTTSGNVILGLPTGPTVGKIWNVKLIEASNYCQLRTAGSETIDGAATKNITILNTTVTVQYDGNNYIIL